MEVEEFETEREFKKKFPVNMYSCPMCNKIVTSPIYCRFCGFRADGFFKTLDQGYKYRIKENGNEEIEIFRPIINKNQQEGV